MKIKFDDLTDQQCVDIIAHFVDKKMRVKLSFIQEMMIL